VIWVYAITDGGAGPVPEVAGIEDTPVESIAAGGLEAAVSRHAEPPSALGEEALWAHERVVERLMADRAVLPMNFGTMLPADADLERALAARRDAFAAALDRVRGRVELGLRVVSPDAGAAPAPEKPVSGRDYVYAKLARSRAADAVHEPLAGMAIDARRRVPRTADGEVLRAAYLVERDAVEHFRATVERLAEASDGLALLCTGPWPPYAFVEAPDHEPVAR
jgi:hypothetical protein